MRAVKLLVSSVLSIAVVLCLASSAMATITSAQSSVSVDPTSPNKVQVYSSYSQDPVDQNISVANFIMPRWDSTCSQAGYIDLGYGGTPNGVIDGPDFSSFNTNVHEHISNFTLNPINQQTCIGTVAHNADDSEIVVDAHPGYYNLPYFEYSGDDATNDSLTIDLDLTPNGLATTYHLTYFKRIVTTNCSSPDPEDLPYAANTASVEVTTNLLDLRTVSVTIPGLETESDYCISWHSNNAAGSTSSIYWGYTTDGNVPEIDDFTPTGGIGSIEYSLDVTPGTAFADTSLFLDYFVKSGETCAVPVGGASTEDISYAGPGGEGLRGFNAITVENELTGLEAATAYCVRARSANYYGDGDVTSYATVETLEQEAPTVDEFRVTPYADVDFPQAMKFTLNDHGAKAVTGNDSYYTYDVYKTPAVDCNESNYNDGQGTIGGGGYFGFTDPLTIPFSDFDDGQPYCIRFTLESSFGSAFDSEAYISYYGGSAPTLTDAQHTVDHAEITFTGQVDPGYQETFYGVIYFKLAVDEVCADADEEDFSMLEPGGTLSAGLTGNQPVSTTLTNLDPHSDYCLRFLAESGLGQAGTSPIMVSTGAQLDTSPPSAPTNLVASNVTRTSATLSWTPSTDDVGVTHYDVIDGTLGLIGSTGSTSKSVTLTCGQTSQFHVIAYDEDNASEKSDTIEITGSACEVIPPPGGGTTTPPAAKTCFEPIKTKSVKGKNGKKKLRVTLTFKVAADGQSIAVSSKFKGTTLTFRIDGKKVTPKKGGVTITAQATSVTVTYKAGKKTRTIKIKPQLVSC